MRPLYWGITTYNVTQTFHQQYTSANKRKTIIICIKKQIIISSVLAYGWTWCGFLWRSASLVRYAASGMQKATWMICRSSERLLMRVYPLWNVYTTSAITRKVHFFFLQCHFLNLKVQNKIQITNKTISKKNHIYAFFVLMNLVLYR